MIAPDYLDNCVTCGRPREAHYGVLKTCNIYPTYRSARDVIASVDTHAKRGDSTQIEAPSLMGSVVGDSRDAHTPPGSSPQGSKL